MAKTQDFKTQDAREEEEDPNHFNKILQK